MPPFVPLADGAQVEIGFLYPDARGLKVENRLWFTDRNPPMTLPHLQALADGVASWHAAQLLPLLSSQIKLLSVIATDWTVGQPLGFAQSFVDAFGGDSSGIHSANVSFRVRFKPDSSAPRLYNSNFLAGVPLGQVDTNQINHGWALAVRDAYINLIDLAPGFGGFPGWRWVCTSRILDGAYRTEQVFARTDFIQIPNPYISPRRRRITRLKKLPP